ncbi:tryptophan RNA-binding attenuator protein-like domain-containing protein [Globomyces pollinis-pini]|nr:tryptophan RNA-binding attenuator protein-like domain-containing protein [Globomyces pollinis-pini]
MWNGPPGHLVHWLSTSANINQKFAVLGTDSQIVQVMLNPQETLVSQPRVMVYRGEQVSFRTNIGGLMKGFKRMMGGESLFKNNYTNEGTTPACVTVGPSFPGKVIPVDLSLSGPLLARPGVYLAHFGDVQISFQLCKSLMAGCFGGNGLWLLKLSGTGTVFLEAGGTIMEKVLGPGEQLVFDHTALLAFSHGAQYGVKAMPDVTTCCFGGEGLFNAFVTGPGLVVVQTMAKEKFFGMLTVNSSPNGASSGATSSASTITPLIS